MFIIQRFWANCTIFNTKLTLSEACHLFLMQIPLATLYRFAIFQEGVYLAVFVSHFNDNLQKRFPG